MDVFLLEAVVTELARSAVPARIDKVHQPRPDTMVWRLWDGRRRHFLLLAAGSGGGRIGLTEAPDRNPPAPPRFAQLLRARLRRLEAITQVSGERIVHLDCNGADRETYTVIAEMTGQRSNLILVDRDRRIVDALRRQPGRQPGARDILPGRCYRMPPPLAGAPLKEAPPPVPPSCDTPASLQRWLLKSLRPISPAVAAVMAELTRRGDSPEALLADFRRDWLASRLMPARLAIAGRTVETALPEPWIGRLQGEPYASPATLLAAGGSGNHDLRILAEARDGLRRQVEKERKRVARRRRKIDADQEKLEEWSRQRRWGELLLAHLGAIPRHAEEAEVTDWFAEPPVPFVIPLDPRLTPEENASTYLRRAGKAERGAPHIHRRLEQIERDRQWLDSLELTLEEAQTGDELGAITSELEAAGLRPQQAGRNRPVESGPPAIGQARTPGGFELLWGKNNRANDLVTRQLGRKDDLWFHAHNQPGCHLILRRSGPGPVTEADLAFAASLAAGYSRAKNDQRVEVMMASCREVRKFKGARPGQVKVGAYSTLTVPPRRL